MLGLASRWGVKGLDAFVAGLATGFPRRGLRRDEARSGPHRRRPAVDRPSQDRPAGRARRHRPRHARRRPPDLASGLIAAVARSDSPEVGPAHGGRDGADDPGGPQGERPGAARQDRLDERAGRAGSKRVKWRCPSSRSTSRRPWRPTRTEDRRAGQGPAGQGGRVARSRIARRSSRRWRRSS